MRAARATEAAAKAAGIDSAATAATVASAPEAATAIEMVFNETVFIARLVWHYRQKKNGCHFRGRQTKRVIYSEEPKTVTETTAEAIYMYGHKKCPIISSL